MTEIDRRVMMQAGIGLILARAAAGARASAASAPGAKTVGTGPGDFDFLAGEWVIRSRRLKDDTSDMWETFEGGATVHRLLGGQASIEELRANGKFLGLGVRVWHPEEQMWADHWTSAANGVVNAPQLGRFIDGAGIFGGEAVDGESERWRGIWDEITPISCRWHQQVSHDAGKSWNEQWIMHWTRVGQ